MATTVEIYIMQKLATGIWRDSYRCLIPAERVLDVAKKMSKRSGVKVLRVSGEGGWVFDARPVRSTS